jgi:hypothetical protein
MAEWDRNPNTENIAKRISLRL